MNLDSTIKFFSTEGCYLFLDLFRTTHKVIRLQIFQIFSKSSTFKGFPFLNNGPNLKQFIEILIKLLGLCVKLFDLAEYEISYNIAESLMKHLYLAIYNTKKSINA